MRKTLSVILLGMLIILFAGCGSGGSSSGSSSMASSDDSTSAKIDSSGGSLTTPNGEAGLDVPAGAVSESKTITVSSSKKQTPPGSIAVPYDYTPDSQTFSSPVTICMKYDPASIPEGMSPSDLRIALLSDNGEWETTGTSTVDTTNYMVCGQTTHFSTYSIVVHERKNFGEQIGDFNSVIAYSNGTTGNTSNINNTYNSYTTGMKWQSDEYVNRYYKQIYNQEIRVAGQIANDYYQNAAERGLEAYPNDGTEQPQVGDILVSEYGDGHLAIVREVQANKIFVIQQNWSNNGADNRYPIARNGNHVYPFDGKKGNYAVKGWLRDTTTPTYSISGTVYGASVSGVTITLTGAAIASTTTDVSGNYSFTGLVDGIYAVTPAKTGYTFTPSSRNVTVNGENEGNINFTSAVNVTPTYTISGTVSGAVQSGVTITLTGTGSSTTTTDASGNYSFTGAANGDYTITATKTGYSFSPTSINVTVNNANVTGKNFTATANVSPTYTISGTVSGAIVSGVTITLTGTGSNSTTTDSSGNYSFTGAANGSYTITIWKTGYYFRPTSISVTVNNANVSGQNFTAHVINVARTGQTKCFNGGTEIPCAGTGQDGEYQSGVAWPNPRFIDHQNGTVTDLLTGLMWTKNGNAPGIPGVAACPGGGYVAGWNIFNYVKCLNDNNFLGYNDWRLPNRNEFRSLVDHSRKFPALPEGHPFNYSGGWTSTTNSNNTWSIHTVGINEAGTSGFLNRDNAGNIWPVRSAGQGVYRLTQTGQSKCYNTGSGVEIPCDGTTGQDGDLRTGVPWPSPRFNITGNCIVDNLTGLTWVRNPDNVVRSWQEALQYANALELCGVSDWRLPNINELESLVNFDVPDVSAWLNSQGFSGIIGADRNAYFSSTINPGDVVYVLRMLDGFVIYAGWDNSFTQNYTLPVRSGPLP